MYTYDDYYDDYDVINESAFDMAMDMSDRYGVAIEDAYDFIMESAADYKKAPAEIRWRMSQYGSDPNAVRRAYQDENTERSARDRMRRISAQRASVRRSHPEELWKESHRRATESSKYSDFADDPEIMRMLEEQDRREAQKEAELNAKLARDRAESENSRKAMLRDVGNSLNRRNAAAINGYRDSARKAGYKV